MTTEELHLFIKKAHKLEKSQFWKWLNAPRGQSDMSRIFAGDWLAHDGLSEEALDSFCLTLRLLIQERDGISVRDVRKEADKWDASHTELKKGITEAIDELHKQLDQTSLVNFSASGKTTNSMVFDIVFYGGLVHSDKRKRDEFDRITRAGLFSYFVFQAFAGTLFHYRNCIQRLAHFAARYLESQSTSKAP